MGDCYSVELRVKVNPEKSTVSNLQKLLRQWMKEQAERTDPFPYSILPYLHTFTIPHSLPLSTLYTAIPHPSLHLHLSYPPLCALCVLCG